MPKKLVSRIMPGPKQIERMQGWGWFSRQLFAEDLWHLNRRTVSIAFLNGIFWACMPMPLQMVPSAFCALILRCNVPLSVGLVWLTNPVTMPPYYLSAYTLGAHILGSKSVYWPDEVTVEWIQNQLNLIWWPLLTGSLVFGIALGLAGYLIIRYWWIWEVNMSWKKRGFRLRKKLRVARGAKGANDLPATPRGDHESQ